MLNKRSGLMGLCGVSDGKETAQCGLDKELVGLVAKKVQVHRMCKYLGVYMVASKVETDALVFTDARTLLCEDLHKLGWLADESRDKLHGVELSKETSVHSHNSLIQIWVIPTRKKLLWRPASL